MANSDYRIGSKYIKAMYREYKDAKFDTLRFGAESRFNPASRHLGILAQSSKLRWERTLKYFFEQLG